MIFRIFKAMETKVTDTHPFLQNSDERFKKMLNSIVDSFQIEGIHFSDEELNRLVNKVESELKR